MKKLICLAVAFFSFITTIIAQGTEIKPTSNGEYEVSTEDHLLWIADQTNNKKISFSGKTVVLTTDIELKTTNWTPIGTSTNIFEGSFDGKGHKITNLNINSTLNYIGFFGSIQTGTIRNLTIEINQITTNNSSAKSNVCLGGIAGRSSSTIVNCKVYQKSANQNSIIANVKGNGQSGKGTAYVGGIAGETEGAIYNCFVDNVIINRTSDNGAGGCIVGTSKREVKNCIVTSTTPYPTNCNWIAGEADTKNLNSNYRRAEYNQTSDDPNSLQGGILNSSTTITSFLNDGIQNFTSYGSLFTWDDSGNLTADTPPVIETAPFENGDGTEANPYQIQSSADLVALANMVNQKSDYNTKYYIVTTDIDLKDINWTPIGSTNETPFSGNFNGNGKTIKNITMATATNYGGLFGYVSAAKINNVILCNVAIRFNIAGGGLAGTAYTQSEISNNFIYGNINITPPGTGNNKSNFGRFFGMINNSTLTENYATGNKFNKNGEDGITLTTETSYTTGTYALIDVIDYVDASNCTGTLFCLNNKVNHIKLGSNTKQRGWLQSDKIELTSTTDISEFGIENTGDIMFKYVPEIYEQPTSGNGGWTTICLPFDANSYKTETDGNETKIDPVTKNKSGAYWLREFVAPPTNGDNKTLYFASYTTLPEYAIKKNTPYIIAIPGDGYGEKGLNGKLIFKGTGAIQYTKNNPQIGQNGSDYVFIGCPKGTSLSKGYVLNDTGDQFINTEAKQMPFYQAYFLPKATATAAPTLHIATGTNQPTDLTDSFAEEKNVNAYTSNGVLYLTTNKPQVVKIYHAITGMTVHELEVNENTTQVSDLPKGIYLINHQKVVIY